MGWTASAGGGRGRNTTKPCGHATATRWSLPHGGGGVGQEEHQRSGSKAGERPAASLHWRCMQGASTAAVYVTWEDPPAEVSTSAG